MHDLSIDLETLGTRPNAPIVAIGAVMFDRETGEIGDEFYAPIKLSSALLHGTVCPHSLKWWFTQSEKAQAVFTSPDAMELRDALLELSMLIVRHSETIRPWGNGSTFDISILEHAYDIVDLEVPWLFWNVRDMRTIVDAAVAIGLDRDSIPFAGIEHNALDDARHQAKVIAACWKKLAVSPAVAQSVADERDAQRYRWLRSQCGQEHHSLLTVQHELDGIVSSGDLDAAIDAARAALYQPAGVGGRQP